MSVKMKFNGKQVTNSRQLEREMKKCMEREMESSLRRAARGTVRIKKTSKGFIAEGTPEQLERFNRRLK